MQTKSVRGHPSHLREESVIRSSGRGNRASDAGGTFVSIINKIGQENTNTSSDSRCQREPVLQCHLDLTWGELRAPTHAFSVVELIARNTKFGVCQTLTRNSLLVSSHGAAIAACSRLAGLEYYSTFHHQNCSSQQPNLPFG